MLGSGKGRGLVGLSCAVVLCLGAAAPAQAMDWEVRQLQGEAGEVALFGISCPSAGFCAAVGGNNLLATSTNPSGGLASWSVKCRATGW